MPLDEGRITYQFAFTPNLRIWSRGSSDLARSDQLKYSDDFGQRWKYVNTNTDNIGSDGIIVFVDDFNGWIVNGRTVLKSSDSGSSWVDVRLPAETKITKLQGIAFANVNQGCVSGTTAHVVDKGAAEIAYGMEILCTSDGGKLWNIVYTSDKNDKTIRLLSSKDLRVALVDQSVLLVNDGQVNEWNEKNLDFPATDLFQDNTGQLWATGEDGFLRTTKDFGETWKVVLGPAIEDKTFSWNSVTINRDGFGVVVGDMGYVAVTKDSGRSWFVQPLLDKKVDLWTVRLKDSYVVVSDSKRFYFAKG
jgi:photosystem II stability/assembly factor-like uncharacterized protein